MGTNSLRFRCMAYSPMLLRQDLQQADHGGNHSPGWAWSHPACNAASLTEDLDCRIAICSHQDIQLDLPLAGAQETNNWDLTIW